MDGYFSVGPACEHGSYRGGACSGAASHGFAAAAFPYAHRYLAPRHDFYELDVGTFGPDRMCLQFPAYAGNVEFVDIV